MLRPNNHQEMVRTSQIPLSQPNLTQLAEQIAAGELPFPPDLVAEDLVPLAQAVRVHRRGRLTRFLARQIALGIRAGDSDRNGIYHERSEA